MSMSDPRPDYFKMAISMDCDIEINIVSQAATTWTVPADCTWYIIAASVDNNNRATTGTITVNDGAAKIIYGGMAEDENMITGAALGPLREAWTVTLTDDSFVAADVVRKTIVILEVHTS